MKYLTADNWKDLFTLFPGLECRALAMNHKNELDVLKRKNASAGINTWEKRRLDELKELARRGGLNNA